MYKKKRVFICLFVLIYFCVAPCFYVLQNSAFFPGGDIALVKLLWLTSVIFFWFIAPFFLLESKQLNAAHTRITNIIVSIHLVNVYSRAVVELYLM
jgi:hypothetical protein